jgi:amino acid adenylation domain-containing protein
MVRAPSVWPGRNRDDMQHAITTAIAAESPRRAWRSTDLAQVLCDVAERHADRLALAVDGESYSYRALFGRARQLAGLLTRERVAASPNLGAVMGTRSHASFVGVLANLLSGAAYVPLNPKFPAVRTEHMLRASGARSLIIERRELEVLAEVVAALEPLVLVVPDAEGSEDLASRFPRHRIFTGKDIDAASASAVPAVGPEAMAYLMFTSGSTGLPKGVMVSHGNVLACTASFGDRYDIGPEDRFSQNFELTFDLSVFDMFLCWAHGASLHVPPPAQQPCPAKMVAESKLTVWFSVPAMALFMQQMRALKPGAFPDLRLSLFCGERLPARVAEAFGAAAPNSAVENLYGPTEVTIACTVHRFTAGGATADGSVPIGLPLQGLAAAVVDDSLAPVAAGAQGELCFAGPQVALGYWRAPDITAQRFVQMPWDDAQRRWYRTGDLASVSSAGVLEHHGRADDQVKVRGYRIELGEIETVIRRQLDTERVSVVAVRDARRDLLELVAFIAAPFEEAALRAALVTLLPDYMQPARLVSLEALPLSSNGKVDKNALRAMEGENR